MTSAGWAWIFGALDVTTVHIQGWLCMREVLPSADMLRAFTEQVKDYNTLYFTSTAALCLDRNDTSKHGTTCAQSLLYCKAQGINWLDPAQTNAQACPDTCGKCPEILSEDLQTVDQTYSATLYDAVRPTLPSSSLSHRPYMPMPYMRSTVRPIARPTTCPNACLTPCLIASITSCLTASLTSCLTAGLTVRPRCDRAALEGNRPARWLIDG